MDLHPGHITKNLAVEHTSGVLEGMRTVYGREWIARHLASIYVLFLTGQTTAVILEKQMDPDGPTFTVRYSLTEEEPDAR